MGVKVKATDEFSTIEPGRYHVMVTSAELRDANDRGGPTIIVMMKILAGTNEEMVGKSHKEYFTIDKAPGRLRKWAESCGIITADQVKKAKALGEEVDIEFEDATGKTLIVGFADETYQGVTRSKIGFRMWRVDEADVKDTPKCQAAVEGRLSVEDATSGDFGGDSGPAGGESSEPPKDFKDF